MDGLREVGAAILQAFGDVLTFRAFLTPGLLVITYYLGAVSAPLFAWLAARRLREQVEGRGQTWSGSDRSRKWQVAGLTLLILVLMELAWRVIIEFLLAYFQIREGLVNPPVP